MFLCKLGSFTSQKKGKSPNRKWVTKSESLRNKTQPKWCSLNEWQDHVELGDDGETPIPKRDWQRYLANKENTKELFSFLSKQLSSNAQLDDILLLSTLSDKVLINKSNAYDTSRIQPSNHIEADTRIFLHLADAAHSGHTKAYIRTVDSDVVVLAVALFNEIATLTHLWIGFGTGKHYRDIPIHDICKRLTKDEARALLFFHALTGC